MLNYLKNINQIVKVINLFELYINIIKLYNFNNIK